jgi:RHH-type proline utilization regulon transcriptional repressor/proline dehydrogenase/delta 1-pyrroline-5-carboxylate dehydrogenase
VAISKAAKHELESAAEAAVELVKEWLVESPPSNTGSGKQLAGLLSDPKGLKFAVGFIDGVVRPEDVRIAARNLYRLRTETPQFLPPYQRLMLRVGAIAGRVLPWFVIPVARTILRRLVSHLVIDASESKLGAALRKIRTSPQLQGEQGSLVRLNINLLGEAVLGAAEAERRLEGITRLLLRPDVDYVSVKVSSAVAPHSPWAFSAAVEEISEQLTALYEIAASANPPKFINLDMEEYRDLDLTVAVFKRILGEPQFRQLKAGIVLQAYLPDAMAAMRDLQDWAADRRQQGGSAIKVRLVKGANLPMERVDAELHGWPLATVGSKQQADTNYKRVLEFALNADRLDAVELGIAGHNLFDLAFAKCLADARGINTGFQFEMLLGMATEQYPIVAAAASPLILYTPVVHPKEFDVAIAYLIRRLEEGASPENFMSSLFKLRDNTQDFNLERERFLASIADLSSAEPKSHRVQNRAKDRPAAITDFANTPDSDPSTEANRNWAEKILLRAANSTVGKTQLEDCTVTSKEQLDTIVAGAHFNAASWQGTAAKKRADILHRVGEELENNRALLLEVMISEAGKTLDQADPEVSEAIDFAHYYAEQAIALDDLDGATHLPDRLVLVTPPWNFPVAIPAGSTLAALASGAGVILKPAGPAGRCGAVLAELLWKAGVPKSALTLVQLSESQLGQQLVANPLIDRVVLTGSFETAQLFRKFRPDLPILAETSGKNALIITPSADLDLAAKDLAYSAFGHAGQKCSAASIAILVGSVASSERFRRQLVDAVQSLVVAPSTDARAQMGPLISEPDGKLLQGLTELDPGEQWLLVPKPLDESGRLWSPGIRTGVRRGSTSHLVEYFGPVLAVMTAASLREAIEIANDVDYGLTAGLHSLDVGEAIEWVENIQAGNLYINRGTTGAIVQRQPFGGWKRSAIGPGAKAGGPSYLLGFGRFEMSPTRGSKAAIAIADRCEALVTAASSELPERDMQRLRQCAEADQAALEDFYLQVTDRSGLSCEMNLLRHLRADCELRINASASDFATWRSALTARLIGAPISLADEKRGLHEALRKLGVSHKLESESQWTARVSNRRNQRVRMVGELAVASVPANPDIAIFSSAVTASGRIELLPYFREQAISITAHRFGNQIDLPSDVLRAITR